MIGKYSSKEVSTSIGVCCQGSISFIGFFPLGDFLCILEGTLLGSIFPGRRVKEKYSSIHYNIKTLYSFLIYINIQR
jgi:hypothetical protein